MLTYITTDFSQISVWPVTPCNISATKFEFIWTTRNRIIGRRSQRISLMLYGKMGLVGMPVPMTMAAAIYMCGDQLNFEQL